MRVACPVDIVCSFQELWLLDLTVAFWPGTLTTFLNVHLLVTQLRICVLVSAAGRCASDARLRMPPVEVRVVQVLEEFLEVFVHQILFYRELYSAELFRRHRLYGIAVQKARHPQVSAYVSQAISSLKVRIAAADQGPILANRYLAALSADETSTLCDV